MSRGPQGGPLGPRLGTPDVTRHICLKIMYKITRINACSELRWEKWCGNTSRCPAGTMTKITTGSRSLLNCKIYQPGWISRFADIELIQLIAHLIRSPGSIPGVGGVRRKQQHDCKMHKYCLIFILFYFKFVRRNQTNKRKGGTERQRRIAFPCLWAKLTSRL